ncbi:MAG: GGDEF and EAL domain-containing protein, partial [Alphaproteobacteria bacterium]|nr:GGDEF and EAL domain-containing protein [Alphaproteobacteria bacterium]
LFWMASTGLLERAMSMPMGGPYGLTALIEGLTLLAALKFVGAVAPYSDVWPEYGRYRNWVAGGLGTLSLLALLGAPGAALAISAVTVAGAALLSAYLVRRGAGGLQAARVLAPSAAVFALVEMAAALAAFGFFHGNPLASKIIGGFAAAGAVLVALAVASGEGLGLFDGPSQRLQFAGTPAGDASGPQPELSAAIGASHQGVYELDFSSDTLRLSAYAAILLGLPEKPLVLGHPGFLSRIHPDDRLTYKQALSSYRAHPGLAFRIEFRVRNEGGRYAWLELRASMQGRGDRADTCLGLIADVTARKESEAASFDRSLRDGLTGLGNRVALMGAVERLGRQPRKAVLAVLDIDRFKTIHGSLGDAGGDAVLRHVAERLVRRYASTAEIFRAGGDAFALLFKTRGAEADQIGAELVELCSAALTENGRRIFAPASIGVARGADCAEPIDLISNAELALRLAKRAGGGCARVYSPDMDGSVPADAVRLEAELRRALEDGQIDLFYQPILHLPTRTVAGFEALMRWHHPERGMIWPSDFVAHCEESGLIVTLGRFAIERAVEDLARWQRQFPVEPALFVSVNVSRRQLLDDRLAQVVATALSRHQLAAGSLCLEITESAIAAVAADTPVLAELKQAGAVLAIDDFGTGLSNLSQLSSLPVDALKIDRSFLTRGAAGKDADVILASIIRMATELNRYVVVEGVEQDEEVDRLSQMGCRLAQGFLFSSAMPAAEVQNFVALHRPDHAHAQPADD